MIYKKRTIENLIVLFLYFKNRLIKYLIIGTIIEYMITMKKILLISFLTSFTLYLSAQNEVSVWDVAEVTIENQDTIYLMNLPMYQVSAKAPFFLRMKIKKYNKLIRDVKKTYPYAKLAANKMKEYEKIVLATKTKADRKQKMEEAELNLTKEFQDEIKKLTFKQGIILMKLIDRETGESSYAIIQELRGSFKAFFWQTFARIFGYNLKIKYDPLGNDKDIEQIVLQIERGEV